MNTKHIGLAGFVFFVFANVAQAGDALEFSADVVNQMGGQTMQMKMYVANDKVRSVSAVTITIARMDQKVSSILMPSERTYMEQPIDPTMAAKTSRTVPGEFERVSMGEETVNGQAAEKYKISFNGPEGRQSIYQWARKDGIPVRVQAVDGSWVVDYQNINAGPQPASLFEVPPGYQKMGLPGMGNLQSMTQSMGLEDEQEPEE